MVKRWPKADEGTGGATDMKVNEKKLGDREVESVISCSPRESSWGFFYRFDIQPVLLRHFGLAPL